MSETFSNVMGQLLAQKGAAATLNYTLDYTPDMGPGEALTNSVWTESTGTLVLSGNAFSNSQVTIVVSGGLAQTWYILENVATGNTGLTHESSIRLYVSDAATLGAGIVTPFPNLPAAIASLRRDRLYSIMTYYMPGGTLDDDYLLQKLVSATSYVQHRLRCFLTPVEMLPNTALASEFAAFDATIPPTPWATEPPYDYDPAMFIGNTWGRTETRQRPLNVVHSMSFVYPAPTSTLFTIPQDWIRIDSKYGVINLLPIQDSMMLPLNAYLLSALGGGRLIPEFLQIRYQAGLTNCARQYPEILDCIKRSAILSIMEDLFVPSNLSQSTSADGLSQSVSMGFKLEDYTKTLDEKIDKIKQSLFGIPMWSV
jgi:hypothetical protein